MSRKDNAVARDLWAQIFARQSSDPNAAMWDPEYDPSDDMAKMRKAFRAAGWSEDETRHLMEIHNEHEASAPTTSPGVSRFVEAQYAKLCDDIEAAMDRLKLNSQFKVARGIEPRVGPYAATTNVIMTDEGIVTVSAHLFRFCGLVARAFTRTLLLNPWVWERDDYEEVDGIALLRGAPDLLRYWMSIYFSFAASGTHIGVPYRPSTKEEIILMEQVARAMEIFSIAHEFSHHHLDHGRSVETDPRQEELEADQFALKICYEVDKRPTMIENPYLMAGAGGVVILMALDTLSEIEAVLGKHAQEMDTHPTVGERLERSDSVRVVFPNEFKWLKGFRTASSRIMALVNNLLVSNFSDLPAELLADMRKLRELGE